METKDYSIFPLIFNGSNLNQNGFNNRYTYTFPGGGITFPKSSHVTLSNIALYYSIFNITAQNQNNSFQYTYTTGAGTTTRTVNIPDGFYEISDLNNLLQQDMIAAGFYLVDNSGNFVYYLEIVQNPTYYAIQVNTYAFPNALPAGYTNPNAIPFPVNPQTTQLIVPASNNFGTVIGYAPATYPAVIQTTTQTFLSTSTPVVSPVQSLVLTCSLLNNKFSNPTSALYSFSFAGTSFGNIIERSPNEYFFVDIVPGQYNEITIEFLDQNFNKVKLNDTDLIVQLLVSVPKISN